MNTNYFLNCVTGNVFGISGTPELPSSYYIGLSSTAPTISGGNVTEPASNVGYDRVMLTDLSEPVNGAITNTNAIVFAESTADWGTMTHFVVYDSAESGTGNLLMYGALSSPRTVERATIMTIKPGLLRLSVQNPE